MPYSMFMAEPIGFIAGTIAGRLSRKWGVEFAGQMGLPPSLGAGIAVLVSHYLASIIAKGIVNTFMLDGMGLAANVAVTSPASALSHGIFEALLEAFPDLAQELPDVMLEVEQEIQHSELFSQMFGPGTQESLVRPNTFEALFAPDRIDWSDGGLLRKDQFVLNPDGAFGQPDLDMTHRGGRVPSQEILEKQTKGDCGSQMLEKIWQMYHGQFMEQFNNLSEALQQQLRAKEEQGFSGLFPGLDWGSFHEDGSFRFIPARYADVLTYLDVPSGWFQLDRDLILTALDSFRVVGVVVDVSNLPDYSNLTGTHAVTLTGYSKEASGELWYCGIDTNNPTGPTWWKADVLERAVRSAATTYEITPYSQEPKCLVTKLPAKW